MALADWDARLISPERALRLAGDWPLYASCEKAQLSEFGSQPDQWQVNLRCDKDHQSMGLLGTVKLRTDNTLASVYYESTSIGDLLSGVLRHLVTAHDIPLSGAPDGH
jgi:hypothetical protein